MLLNLYKKKWNQGLKNQEYNHLEKKNKESFSEIKRLSKEYKEWIKKENQKTSEEFAVSSVGKVDPKRHLLEQLEEMQERCVLQNFGVMMNLKVF